MPISAGLLDPGEDVLVDLRPHWISLAGPVVVLSAALAVAVAVATEFPHAPVGVVWVLAAMVAVPALWLVARLARWLSTSLVLTTTRLVLTGGVLRRQVVQLRLLRVTEVHCVQSLFDRLVGAGRVVVEVEGEDQAVVVDDVRRPRTFQRVLNARLNELTPGTPAMPPPAPGTPPAAGTPPFPRAPLVPIVPGGAGGPSTGEADLTPPRGLPLADPSAVSGAQSVLSGSGPTGQGDASSLVYEQLVQLDDLRRRGIVTNAEFDAKKAELLGRL